MIRGSLPPRGSVGAEIGLGPRRQLHLIVDDVDMGKGEGEGCGPSDNFALVVVLRAVAWANVLVCRNVPGSDAACGKARGVGAGGLSFLGRGNARELKCMHSQELNKARGQVKSAFVSTLGLYYILAARRVPRWVQTALIA